MPKDFFTAEWFPYQVDRFENSDKVAQMSPAVEGIYHRAIRLAWKFRELPADPIVFAARVKGCTPKIANQILKTFVRSPDSDGKVVHPVVEEVRAEQEKKYLDRVKGGRASGISRRNKGTSNNTQAELELSSSSAATNRDLDLEKDLKHKIVSVPAREIFLGTVTAEISKRLDLKVLSTKLAWQTEAEIAFKNQFTADDFLECFDLLTQQHWRDGPVKPKHVTEYLPKLNKLRKEIEKQSNGQTSNGNKTTPQTPPDPAISGSVRERLRAKKPT